MTAPAIAIPAPIPPPIDLVTPPKSVDYNRTGLDFRRPVPRPKVRGKVIDFHTHLFAHRHLKDWQETNRHYGIDLFITMTPLEEALGVQRALPGRVQFIAIPKWGDSGPYWVDEWLRRLESFYNLGSRIIKFHMAPGTMAMRNYTLESPGIQKIIQEAIARDMILMSHVGDPDTWYAGKYTDHAQFGDRETHYRIWEDQLKQYRDRAWVGAHLGGNPENPARLQHLLDAYPNLYLDLSATRWMVREISQRRDAMREFVIRNADRLLWGSDQVSGDARGFDFLASRLWCHRKLWETAYVGPSPIVDPDVPDDAQPTIRGLALPDDVLQKIYRDNTVHLLSRFGVRFADA
jgi:hypothetical protein